MEEELTKVIVAGGRDFNDRDLLFSTLDGMFTYGDDMLPSGVEIVSGAARGADSLAIDWAVVNWVPLKEFPANWAKYGRAAGPIRNREMAEYADELVAFWDGTSHGTQHMIETAEAMDMPVRIVSY